MKTYWDLLAEDLYETCCDWCANTIKEVGTLYQVEGDNVCQDCLENTEVEDHPSLTLEERNNGKY